MQAQEIFDTVVKHLAKQGGPAREPKGMMYCLYRAPDGRKCAAGALIPDEVYHASMEGSVIETLIREPHNLPDFFRGNKDLIGALQYVHDNGKYAAGVWTHVGALKVDLQDVAQRYGLSAAVVSEAFLTH